MAKFLTGGTSRARRRGRGAQAVAVELGVLALAVLDVEASMLRVRR
jgi:hypothetical protein